MKKTFSLTAPGRHPDRVLDAVKHEIRKYLRRERRRELPDGVDFLDFDCRFGRDQGSARTVRLAELIGLVDAAARDGAGQVYVEILAKPGHRTPRPRGAETLSDAPPAGTGPGSEGASGDAEAIAGADAGDGQEGAATKLAARAATTRHR